MSRRRGSRLEIKETNNEELGCFCCCNNLKESYRPVIRIKWWQIPRAIIYMVFGK